MEIRSILIFLFFVSLFVVGFACKDNFIEQPNDDPDAVLSYQWTVDTLFYTPGPGAGGNTYVTSIGGSSDSAVFATASDAWNGRGSLWLFNGKIWDRVKLFNHEGGGVINQALDLNSILSFSSNDIYTFGNHFYSHPSPPPNFLDSAMALHFDGTQWKELTVPRGTRMYEAAAYSSHDFYVGGADGLLFHYLNGDWSVDTIRTSYFPHLSSFSTHPVSCSSDGVYLTTFQYNENDGNIYHQFVLYSHGAVTVLDSTTSADHAWGGRSYWRSPSGALYSVGAYGIYHFQGSGWSLIHATERLNSITGTSDNRIFALASSGNVYYYNGKEWRVVAFIDMPYPVLGRMWCTETSVFISVFYNSRSFVYRGFK